MPAPNAPAAAMDKAATRFESSSASSLGAACSLRVLACRGGARSPGGATKPADRSGSSATMACTRRRMDASGVNRDAATSPCLKRTRFGLSVALVLASLPRRQPPRRPTRFFACQDPSVHPSEASWSFTVAIARVAPSDCWLGEAAAPAKGQGRTAQRRARGTSACHYETPTARPRRSRSPRTPE